MYVQFSEPMKTIGNLEKIKLMDQSGEVVSGAIFNNVYELWDTEQKQLTLILDPARVKSGLVANESLGRALQPGQSYQLLIEDLESVQHHPLKAAYRKSFYVRSQDTIPPNVQSWELIPPEFDNAHTLVVRFTDVLDQMSLRQRLVVVNDLGEAVPGTIEIIAGEQEWHFKPYEDWISGHYLLYVNARLADPAGNNLNGKFDHQVGTLKFDKEGQNLKIPFRVMN
ncbi:MAG: hypothetical protein AAFO02_09380 [Bacteroidota bacterium]